MRSNFITIYPHDCSKAFAMEMSGYFTYDDLIERIQMKDIICVFSQTVDVIKDGQGFLLWAKAVDCYYKWTHKDMLITEIEFYEMFKSLEYKAQFETLINE